MSQRVKAKIRELVWSRSVATSLVACTRAAYSKTGISHPRKQAAPGQKNESGRGRRSGRLGDRILLAAAVRFASARCPGRMKRRSLPSDGKPPGGLPRRCRLQQLVKNFPRFLQGEGFVKDDVRDAALMRIATVTFIHNQDKRLARPKRFDPAGQLFAVHRRQIELGCDQIVVVGMNATERLFAGRDDRRNMP